MSQGGVRSHLSREWPGGGAGPVASASPARAAVGGSGGLRALTAERETARAAVSCSHIPVCALRGECGYCHESNTLCRDSWAVSGQDLGEGAGDPRPAGGDAAAGEGAVGGPAAVAVTGHGAGVGRAAGAAPATPDCAGGESDPSSARVGLVSPVSPQQRVV